MEPNDSQDERKRGKPSKDRPWCWCEKVAVKMITETFSESKQSASARSLYLALCELASDKQSETFTANKALIAHKAGVSVSTAARLLNGLEELGLVKIDRNVAAGVFKAPNTYTLLAIGHSDLSIGNGRKRSKTDKVEKSRKTRSAKKTRSSNGTRHRSADVVCFDGSELVSEEQREAIDYYNAMLAPRGWLPVNKLAPEIEKALDTFYGDNIRSLVEAVIERPDDVSIPKRKTLVRLLWDNY